MAAWFWKPGDLLKEHENRDHKPYPWWASKGFIEGAPGRAIDYGFVVRRIADIALQYDVVALAFDRWRIEQILQRFNDAGIAEFVEGVAMDARTHRIGHAQEPAMLYEEIGCCIAAF